MNCCSKRFRGGQSRSSQRGYVLLTLLLMMAMIAIAAAIVAPTLATQIRRDREDELIHREMQYRTAIRRFIKQTGRYPMTLDDLDKGQVRYLRRRYKDPMTGRDFKLLHMLDIPRVGGGLQGSLASQQPSTNVTASGDSSGAAGSAPGDQADATGGETQPQAGQDATAGQTGSAGQAGVAGPGAPSANPQSAGPAAGQAPSFGGGVIIGVTSTSNKKTIREFNHKDRYNQWLFYYDPSFDRVPEIYGPTPTGIAATAMFGQGLSTPQSPNANPQSPTTAPPSQPVQQP
jgi:type II secretory pathway pseudopilin PulG